MDIIVLADSERQRQSCLQLQAAVLCCHELLVEQTLVRGVLVQHDETRCATGDDEGVAYLAQRLQSGYLRSHGSQVVGHVSLADMQYWHRYGLPCLCASILFPWEGRRRQALHHHLDRFLNPRKDGALMQEFYFGFTGVDVHVQQGRRQGDSQSRHRMASRWQERAIRSLQGCAHQGTPHWSTVHPAILP